MELQREQVLIQEPGKNTVVLGTQKYEVRPLAFGPLKKAKKVFIEAVTELMDGLLKLQEKGTNVQEENASDIILDIGSIFDLVADRVPAVFGVFLPKLDPAVFEDEDGVTIPQLIAAAETIVQVNGFNKLPNMLRQVVARG